ncbi:unnamed protein product, partial [Rotaria sp. Silwood1]
MKSETLENTVLILVASMTQPWSLLSTLKKWTTLIEEHIDRLQIDPTRLREMRDRLQYDFQHYVEPNDSSTMLTSSASSTTIKSGIGGGRVPSSVSSVSLVSTTTPLSPTNGDENIVLPLPDGVLTKSFGIPIIVVITKCDVMSTLEKENDYKDEHFDFMQHHLRKFGLEYGAALFYTSVKEKKNIDKLYKYIVHKCYGYPFTLSAAIVDRESIFIPAGWDNPKKADILLENLHRLKSTDNYSDVFVKPVTRRPLQRDNEIIMAEDDQEFLSKLQSTLNRAASPGRTDENATSVPTRPSGGSGGVGSQPTAVAGRSRPQPNATAGNANTTANEGALANFFNSLLTRKSGGAATPTSGSSPATQRQTSQSPTTPSSQRLPQHPLTFAVIPPPGRTRTPTSHKTFPSSLNVESPPRIVSPVVENTSVTSPTIVRTPLEDSKPVEIINATQHEQSTLTIVEPLHLNHNHKQFNDALQLENEAITNVDRQNTESITSQHDSISNTKDNSNTETRIPSSQSSPITEKELNTKQIALNDEIHQPSSNDFSLSQSIKQDQGSEISQYSSSQSTVTEILGNDEPTVNNTSSVIRPRPVSPSQPDEFSNTENQNNISFTDVSRSSFLVAQDNNQLLDLSQSIDHKSSQISSSQTFENTQQLNDDQDRDQQIYPDVIKEKAVEYPVKDIILNNDEEQPTDSKQSLNFSRQNSAIDSYITSQTVSPSLNELGQQEDLKLLSSANSIQTLPQDDITRLQPENELPTDDLLSIQLHRRSSSSDVAESALPITSGPESHIIFEPYKSSSIYVEENSQHASHAEQSDQAVIQTELSENVSSDVQSPTLFSISNSHAIEEQQQNHIFTSDSNTNNNQEGFNVITEMSNKNSDLSTMKERNSSSATDTEKSLDSSVSEYPLSTSTNHEQTNSQSKETHLLNTPTHEATRLSVSLPQYSEPTELIQTPTFDAHQTELHSFDKTTEPSITDDKYEQGQPPLPTTILGEAGNTSLSAVTEPEQESKQFASIPTEQSHERTRSPSPSPFSQYTEQSSRSPSVNNENENEGIQSSSLLIEAREETSRSPSPIMEDGEKRNQSISSLCNQNNEQASSPRTEQNRGRNRST